MTRWLAPLALAAVVVVATPASALTVPDVIELARAGVPASVISGMIDADGTVFTLGKRQLLDLRAAGVPDDVILKMLRTRQVERAKSERAAAEAVATAGPGYPPPSTIAASVGDTPGLVIIGKHASLPEFVPPPLVPTFIVPWVFWPAPLRVRAVPGARDQAPFLSDAERGFGRFINDGRR